METTKITQNKNRVDILLEILYVRQWKIYQQIRFTNMDQL